MRREGFKRGRIRVCSSLFVFPLGGSPLNPKPKEWHTHLMHNKRPLAHPTGVRGPPDGAYALCSKRTDFSYETGKCGRPRCHESWPVGKSRGKGKGARKRRARGDARFYDPDWVLPVRKAALGGSAGRYDVSEDEDDVDEDEGGVRESVSDVYECGSGVCEKEEWSPAGRHDCREGLEEGRLGALLGDEIEFSKEDDWELVNGVNGGDTYSDVESAEGSSGSWDWL